MTKKTKLLPIKIKLEGLKGDFSFRHWKGFNYFMKCLIKNPVGGIEYLKGLAESELLKKCVYFEAKRGTSDKLPMTLKKALKNPIKL